MFDVVITGGTVVDGTGTPGYMADVGVTGEKVDAIGDLSQTGARRVIDASGLAVSPGFIDAHVHSDAALLTDPQHAGGLRQGITTEILGQDGLSYAPLSAESYRMYSRYLSGILGKPPEDLDMSSVESFRAHYHRKAAVNTAYLVPHGAVRLETAGFRDVPLVGDNLERARIIIKEGIEQGAVGFSTGLSYHPNAWADTDELVSLCEAARDAGGVYVTHTRDVNRDRAFGNGGVPEALEIGRRSGVKVHFSHHRTEAHDAGRVAERVELIDKAKSGGVDCTADIYPYPTGSTLAAAMLPSYVHDGGPEAILRRLQDPEERHKITAEIDAQPIRSLHDSVLSYMPVNGHLEGMSLPEVAGERGVSMGEAVCDLLLEEDLAIGFWLTPPDSVAVWRQLSKDAMNLLSRPDYMVGSDSIHAGSLPHPRAYGAFPRFLGRLRRQLDGLGLEQMVQRMTDNPARRFGLTRRGRIQKDYFADIVVFDPEGIIDNATYDDPKQFPTGVPFVLVNGEVAVDRERCTGVLAGQAVP